MNEEKEKKESIKEVEKVPAKPLDELMEPVEKIPDEVFATKESGVIIKVLFKEQSSKCRQLEGKIFALEEQNKELEKKVAVYEERFGWKTFISILSVILVGIGIALIPVGYQFNSSLITKIGYWLILIGIVINLWPIRILIPWFKKGEKEKI